MTARTMADDKAWWNAYAPDEEVDRDDEAINRALRWRAIDRHLDGVKTILDIGAGTGAFSIPLARRGYRVTHLDLAPEMIARARAKAADVGTIDFVEGSALDAASLGRFDLVLALDGVISFAGKKAADVLAAASAATARTLIVTVSNRACMIATWLKLSLVATGRILPAVHEMMKTGLWDKDTSPDGPTLFPEPCRVPRLKAFTVDELRDALVATGLDVVLTRAIGSLSHLLLPHALAMPDGLEGFLDLCEAYDDLLPAGPGSFRRAGLLGVATRSDWRRDPETPSTAAAPTLHEDGRKPA